MPSCWIEVNLRAICENYRAIQELTSDGVQLIAVVKANAYGHGAPQVSRALVEAGVSCLAVTRVEEAIPIRQVGVLAPILLLAPAPPDEVSEIVAHDLTATISCFDDARRLSQAAQAQNKTAHAQLKINTGMGRFGVEPEEAVAIARQIAALPSLQIEAAWTHFAFAGGSVRDTTKVHAQFALFQPLVQQLSYALGISPRGFHCANSSAIVRFPSMRLSCARAGTILYGQMPSPVVAEAATQQRLQLQNTFQAKTRVLAIREVRPGQSVGYGGEWIASRTTRIATIGIGYADGLSQEPRTRRDAPPVAVQKNARQIARETLRWVGLSPEDAPRLVMIHGKRAPIVGRIAMQTCSVNISRLEGVQVGDEVLVSLRRTSAGAHLPRVYKSSNK